MREQELKKDRSRSLEIRWLRPFRGEVVAFLVAALTEVAGLTTRKTFDCLIGYGRLN